MKKIVFALVFLLVSFASMAQLVGESEIKSDANPTYTVPDTVAASETVTFSKAFTGRWEKQGVQVTITKIGSTTIAGATVTLLGKIKEADPWATFTSGTTAHTVTNGDQSVIFEQVPAYNYLQVKIVNGTSGVFKAKVTEKHWRGY